MKGCINSNGDLQIDRKGAMVSVECRIGGGLCSHWCALFGEPVELMGDTYLDLCRRDLCFEEFEDQREEIK